MGKRISKEKGFFESTCKHPEEVLTHITKYPYWRCSKCGEMLEPSEVLQRKLTLGPPPDSLAVPKTNPEWVAEGQFSAELCESIGVMEICKVKFKIGKIFEWTQERHSKRIMRRKWWKIWGWAVTIGSLTFLFLYYMMQDGRHQGIYRSIPYKIELPRPWQNTK